MLYINLLQQFWVTLSLEANQHSLGNQKRILNKMFQVLSVKNLSIKGFGQVPKNNYIFTII